jgi:acyl carrier protein
MGLDAVELIVEIEKHFDIEIDDEDAQYIGKVGELSRYVSKKTIGLEKEYSYEQVLRIVIRMLVENYGVPEGKANSASHFVDDLGLD